MEKFILIFLVLFFALICALVYKYLTLQEVITPTTTWWFLTLNRDIVSSPFLMFHLHKYGQFTIYNFTFPPWRRARMTKTSKFILLFGGKMIISRQIQMIFMLLSNESKNLIRHYTLVAHILLHTWHIFICISHRPNVLRLWNMTKLPVHPLKKYMWAPAWEFHLCIHKICSQW